MAGGYGRSKPAQASVGLKVTPSRITPLPVGKTTKIRRPRVTSPLTSGVRKSESMSVGF